MKKTLIIFCLLLGSFYAQAQTKEETVDYINRIVNEMADIRLKDDVSRWEEKYSEISFTDKQYAYSRDSWIPTPSGPHFSGTFKLLCKGINYRNMMSLTEKPINKTCKKLILQFSNSIICQCTNIPSTSLDGSVENTELELFIPTEKINNVKKALFHLKELVPKEKDLFDN
jgi:hypothetical protein